MKASLIGRALGTVLQPAPPRRVRVASATRMPAAEFWKKSALGLSLSIWRKDARVSVDVAFDNKAGLPEVYNAALDRAAPDEAVLFVHDDVWLDDPQWLDKLLVGLCRFDVVGVAGNTRRLKGQRSWAFSASEPDKFVFDSPHLSGSVRHGKSAGGEPSHFGPTPAACELLDGVLIAVHAEVARRADLRFDERFDFHFYDLDFSRTARMRGLSVGTWPITITHQSGGAFGSPGWRDGMQRYFGKWKR